MYGCVLRHTALKICLQMKHKPTEKNRSINVLFMFCALTNRMEAIWIASARIASEISANILKRGM